MTRILNALRPINVDRTVTAKVGSFAQNLVDLDQNFVDIRTAVNSLFDRIVVLESGASSNPVLSLFHLTSPAQVTVGTTLAGNNYNAEYNIFASPLVAAARLVGRQTVPSGAQLVVVASAARAEGANVQPFVFPASDFSTRGNTYALTIELYTTGQTPGTDTPAQSATQTVVARAAPRQDLMYYGIVSDPTPANVDVSTLQHRTRLDGNVQMPTFTAPTHFVFAYPASASRVTALTFGGGLNQLGAFTLTTNALNLGGVSYNTLISDNLLTTAFSGATATITR